MKGQRGNYSGQRNEPVQRPCGWHVLWETEEAGVAGGQESRGAWHERAERWEGQMGGACKTLANVNKILSSSLSDKPSRSYMFF